MEINNTFKANMEAFRESYCAKGEYGPFCTHLAMRIFDRDENLF